MMTGIELETTWKEEALEYLRYYSTIWLEVLRKTTHSVLRDSTFLGRASNTQIMNHSTARHMDSLILYLQELPQLSRFSFS
jgi:hypothetical protein